MGERNVTHSVADIPHFGHPAPIVEGCNVYGFGHSYLGNPPVAWINRFITRTGAALSTNQSVAGTDVSDAAKKLLNLGYNCISQLTPATLVILDSVINDVAYYVQRAGALGTAPYKNGLRAFLRAAQSGVQVNDTSGTYTGTWTAATSQNGCYGSTYHSTVTQNDSVNVTVRVPPSGVVTFILATNDPNSGVTATANYLIKRGATTVASGSTAGQYAQSGQPYSPNNYGPFAVTITGEPAGDRVYTLSKSDASGPILIFDCVLPECARNAPGILLMKDPHVPAYPDSAVDLINAAMDEVVAEFTTDFDGRGGNGITVVDPQGTGAWDKAGMVKNDGIHHNQLGNAFLAGCAVAAYANQKPWHGINLMYQGGVHIPVPAARKHVYTALKVWSGDATYVYSLDGTDVPFLGNGDAKLLVTGGSGWKPGLYPITSSQLDYATPDGTHTMVQMSGGGPAAAGTTGGVGYLVRV